MPPPRESASGLYIAYAAAAAATVTNGFMLWQVRHTLREIEERLNRTPPAPAYPLHLPPAAALPAQGAQAAQAAASRVPPGRGDGGEISSADAAGGLGGD